MDHTAEASMEEILASIRRIIAAEPKAVKAFADEHLQKSSDPSLPIPPQGLEKSTTSFRGDFSKKLNVQDPTLKVEPSFSSLSSLSSPNVKSSQNATSKTSSQTFAEALDRDLAGLLETPQPSQPQPKKEFLDKGISTEEWSKSNSNPKFNDFTSKGFVPSQNIQPQVNQAETTNYGTSSAGGGSSYNKMEPQFSKSLTSNDFLNGDAITSSFQNNTTDFTSSPKDLFVDEKDLTLSSAEDKASMPFVERANLVIEKKEDAVVTQNSDAQEQIAFSKPSTEENHFKEDYLPAQEASKTYQMSKSESKEEVSGDNISSKASQRTFEDVVSEMLRPILETWVEKNLPHLVPKLLKIDNP